MTAPRLPAAARAAVFGALLAFLAGCGSSPAPRPHPAPRAARATPAGTITLPAPLETKFAASEATVLKAIHAGAVQLRKLPASFAAAQLSQGLQPMVSATATFDRQVSALAWPAGSRPLVDALLAADSAWIASARGLEAGGRLTHADVSRALAADLVHEVRALKRLLAATGEPPLG
jgi:hypothetical protein